MVEKKSRKTSRAFSPVGGRERKGGDIGRLSDVTLSLNLSGSVSQTAKRTSMMRLRGLLEMRAGEGQRTSSSLSCGLALNIKTGQRLVSGDWQVKRGAIDRRILNPRDADWPVFWYDFEKSWKVPGPSYPYQLLRHSDRRPFRRPRPRDRFISRICLVLRRNCLSDEQKEKYQ